MVENEEIIVFVMIAFCLNLLVFLVLCLIDSGLGLVFCCYSSGDKIDINWVTVFIVNLLIVLVSYEIVFMKLFKKIKWIKRD